MSVDLNNQNIESQYTSFCLIDWPIHINSSPMIIVDQMSPADFEPNQAKLTIPDNPNIPAPTKKSIRLIETRRAFLEETKSKEENVRALSGGNGGNPWLKYPNRMCALFIALIDYQTNLSKSRFNDAHMKQLLEGTMFKMGMENANLSKQLKDIAADKEMLKAISSFIQAGIALHQVGSLLQAKAKVQKDLKNPKNSEWPDKIDNQKKKIDKLSKLHGLKGRKDDDGLKKLVKNNPEAAKEIKKEKAKLIKMRERKAEEFNQQLQTEMSVIDVKSRGLNALAEGVFSVIIGLKTKEEGVLEKQKGINDALQQMFSRLDDSASKSKDDALSQLDKILQTLSQYSSDTRVHLSTRG